MTNHCSRPLGGTSLRRADVIRAGPPGAFSRFNSASATHFSASEPGGAGGVRCAAAKVDKIKQSPTTATIFRTNVQRSMTTSPAMASSDGTSSIVLRSDAQAELVGISVLVLAQDSRYNNYIAKSSFRLCGEVMQLSPLGLACELNCFEYLLGHAELKRCECRRHVEH